MVPDTEQTKEKDADGSKRGQRDSPRTPHDPEKLAKLRNIAAKLSPSTAVPALPGLGSAGSGSAGDTAMGMYTQAAESVQGEKAVGSRTDPTNSDIMAKVNVS